MKKKLIILIGAGLVSFAGMFAFAWLTGKGPASAQAEHGQAATAGQAGEQGLPTALEADLSEADTARMKRAMTERQLKSLIYEVRQKITEYESKLEGLKVREQRLNTAHSELTKDIEELENLRVELASTITTLKEERDKLDKTRTEIAKEEQDNLVAIAATYDKMEPASASTILTNMSKAQDGSADDAVKILHYMTDRTKAKVLADLSTAEPKLAAYFCQKLKQITEK